MLRTLPVLDAGLATLVARCVVEFCVVVVVGDDGDFPLAVEGVGVRCEVVEECALPRLVGKTSGIRRWPT